MVTEIELWICDDCDTIGVSGELEKPVCMECQKPMRFVKFYRYPAKDAPKACGNYTPAFFIPGAPCLNCDAKAEDH